MGLLSAQPTGRSSAWAQTGLIPQQRVRPGRTQSRERAAVQSGAAARPLASRRPPRAQGPPQPQPQPPASARSLPCASARGGPAGAGRRSRALSSRPPGPPLASRRHAAAGLAPFLAAGRRLNARGRPLLSAGAAEAEVEASHRGARGLRPGVSSGAGCVQGCGGEAARGGDGGPH